MSIQDRKAIRPGVSDSSRVQQSALLGHLIAAQSSLSKALASFKGHLLNHLHEILLGSRTTALVEVSFAASLAIQKPPMATIYSLPLEVFEQVLLQAARHDFPEVIAGLGRTCRHFFDIIYNSDDSHLWHSIFLATFDDPGSFFRWYSGDLTADFDWKGQFKRRMEAQRTISNLTSAGNSSTESRVKALSTLISALNTTPSFAKLVPVDQEYLLLPPLISRPLCSTSPSQGLHIWLPNSLSNERLDSLNSAWVERVFLHGKRRSDDCNLACSYPTILADRYLFRHDLRGLDEQERQLFMHLVFLRGSEPIVGRTSNELLPTGPDAKLLARVLARRRVYNLPYLTRKRAWGPFLHEDHEFSLAYAINLTNSSGTSIPLTERPHEAVPDYEYLASVRIVVEANLRELTGALELESPSLSNKRFGSIAFELGRIGCAPGAETLRSLAEVWTPDDDRYATEDNSSKVPYTRADISSLPFEVNDTNRSGVRGWDWAGVEGKWRRCVCWLDYRDLILQNLNRDPAVIESYEEAARVFPMTLRVVRYSPPPQRPRHIQPFPNSTFALNELVWRLPVIHFEGESYYDHQSQTARRMYGTVRMLSCGAVRWSTTICDHGTNEPRFHTEAIQIGGIGSALGYVGYWTGAEHTRGDPMGPIWAWRVV